LVHSNLSLGRNVLKQREKKWIREDSAFVITTFQNHHLSQTDLTPINYSRMFKM